jgi:hypothetical protein
MAWVRLDDGFMRHPKAQAAGLQGRALFISGLCWCAANLTDGRIPKAMIPLLAFEAGVKPAAAAALVKVGLWDEDGDGYAVHDWLDYNRSRDVITDVRASRSEAGRRGGLRSGDSRRGSNDEANTKQLASANGKQVACCASNPSPAQPSPAQPIGLESSAAAALRCREAPAAAAAAVDLILTIRERQQEGRVLHPVVWRTKTRPKIAEEFADQIAGYLADHPDAGAEEIVTAGCGFTRWDIPA